jgi:hypothetical protein
VGVPPGVEPQRRWRAAAGAGGGYRGPDDAADAADTADTSCSGGIIELGEIVMESNGTSNNNASAASAADPAAPAASAASVVATVKADEYDGEGHCRICLEVLSLADLDPDAHHATALG